MPVFWDSNIAAARFRFGIWLVVWSPCNRFIAVSSPHTTEVYILDTTTLQRLQCLEFPSKISLHSEALAFSPDSRTLTSVRNNDQYTGLVVVSWDLQTGGVVSTVKWKGPHDTEVGSVCITYSMDGRMIAVLSRHGSFTIISIYDIVSGIHLHNVQNHSARANLDLDLGSKYVYKIWTQEESLRFVTPGSTGIVIWEVGFAPGATPIEVENVPIPENTIETSVLMPTEQEDIVWIEFHPASYRLAFIGTGGTYTQGVGCPGFKIPATPYRR